jgi:hypothetical protein
MSCFMRRVFGAQGYQRFSQYFKSKNFVRDKPVIKTDAILAFRSVSDSDPEYGTRQITPQGTTGSWRRTRGAQTMTSFCQSSLGDGKGRAGIRSACLRMLRGPMSPASIMAAILVLKFERRTGTVSWFRPFPPNDRRPVGRESPLDRRVAAQPSGLHVRFARQ